MAAAQAGAGCWAPPSFYPEHFFSHLRLNTPRSAAVDAASAAARQLAQQPPAAGRPRQPVDAPGLSAGAGGAQQPAPAAPAAAAAAAAPFGAFGSLPWHGFGLSTAGLEPGKQQRPPAAHQSPLSMQQPQQQQQQPAGTFIYAQFAQAATEAANAMAAAAAGAGGGGGGGSPKGGEQLSSLSVIGRRSRGNLSSGEMAGLASGDDPAAGAGGDPAAAGGGTPPGAAAAAAAAGGGGAALSPKAAAAIAAASAAAAAIASGGAPGSPLGSPRRRASLFGDLGMRDLLRTGSSVGTCAPQAVVFVAAALPVAAAAVQRSALDRLRMPRRNSRSEQLRRCMAIVAALPLLLRPTSC